MLRSNMQPSSLQPADPQSPVCPTLTVVLRVFWKTCLQVRNDLQRRKTAVSGNSKHLHIASAGRLLHLGATLDLLGCLQTHVYSLCFSPSPTDCPFEGFCRHTTTIRQNCGMAIGAGADRCASQHPTCRLTLREFRATVQGKFAACTILNANFDCFCRHTDSDHGVRNRPDWRNSRISAVLEVAIVPFPLSADLCPT